MDAHEDAPSYEDDSGHWEGEDIHSDDDKNDNNHHSYGCNALDQDKMILQFQEENSAPNNYWINLQKQSGEGRKEMKKIQKEPK